MTRKRGGLQASVEGQGCRALGVLALLTGVLAQSICVNSALARGKVPCKYEVAHVIQGPVLPPPTGAPSTIGMAISPNGRNVCGRFAYGIEEDRPFIFDTLTEQFMAPELPPGFYAASFADINDNAIAVGTGEKTDTGQRGFVFNLTTGQWTELEPLPGGLWSGATGINSSNVVCGWRSIGPGTQPQTAFRWSAEEGFEDLGLVNGQSTSAADINNNNVVTGWLVNGVQHPFLWSDNELLDLGSVTGFSAVGTSLNDLNEVTGRIATASDAGGIPHAFRWSSGTMVDLGVLPNHQISHGIHVAANGAVLGLSRKQNGTDQRAVMWIGEGKFDLNTLLPDPQGMFVTAAGGQDQRGTLLVVGRDSTSNTLGLLLRPEFPSVADINTDCRVNVQDLLIVIDEWGKSKSSADVNVDGTVNVVDLFIVVENWSPN